MKSQITTRYLGPYPIIMYCNGVNEEGGKKKRDVQPKKTAK